VQENEVTVRTADASAGDTSVSRATAVASLLAGALVWGVIWYPYRFLRDNGVDGVMASTLTYAVAFLLGAVLFRRVLRSWSCARRDAIRLVVLAVSAGGCNLGYVLATLHGEVVRVLLLFYLAPLWTVMLSRAILGERLNRVGALVIGLSLAGAATILWHPAVGWPLPRDIADWLGLGAGFSFALFNVYSRHARNVPVEVKSMVAFSGVVLVGAGIMAWVASPMPAAAIPIWGLLALLGLVLVIINVVVQYGLSNLPANRAIVIMLTEIGVAALSAWWLAGEAFGWRESLGGAMIIAASVFSARMEPEENK